MYEYILFDLDGTLIEPKEGITKCVAYALDKFNIKISSLDELTVFIGPPLKDSFMKYFNMSEEDALLAVAYYRERFKELGILECELYKNVEETLKKLYENGKKHVVATSKPEVFSISILKRLNIFNYFTFIAGATFDGKRGEKSGVIKYAIESLEIKDLTKVIMIGDRKFDILGAKDNMVDSIGVTYGYAVDNELIESMPNFIINDIIELLEIIK